MQKVRVFLNGMASSSKSQDWEGQIRRGLFRSDLSFIRSKNHQQFLNEIQRAKDDKVEVVISVGGDGTFNTLLKELAETDTSFLVVPAGTANDLARELGISSRLRTAIEAIRKNEIQKIDLITINDQPMATNGGIGLVSDVAASINLLRKKIPGFKLLMSGMHHRVYSTGLAGYLLANRFHRYALRVQSEEFSGEIDTPLLLINNQPTLAGTFPVAPLTMNHDGHFNVTIFKHKTWVDFVAAILRFKQGLPMDHDKQLMSFESKKIVIESTDPKRNLKFFGDGEQLVESKKLIVKIKANALRLYRPFHKDEVSTIPAEATVGEGDGS